MMSGITSQATRLADLRRLRDRIDAEITDLERERDRREARRLAAVPDADVRAWALAHGVEVGPRGKVAAAVKRQYLLARQAAGRWAQ